MEIISNIYLSLLNCVLWAGIAENVVEYCKKGDVIGVKGRIQNRSYDKDEERKFVTEVVAEKISFLSSKNKD